MANIERLNVYADWHEIIIKRCPKATFNFCSDVITAKNGKAIAGTYNETNNEGIIYELRSS